MKGKGNIWKPIVGIFLFVLGVAFWALYVRLPIVTGYVAKHTCSCVFISQRTETNIVEKDLQSFFLNYADVQVDKKTKSATATFFGLRQRTAVFRPHLGCSLVPEGYDPKAIQQVVYTPPPLLPVQADTLDFPLGNRLPVTIPNSINHNKLQTVLDGAFDQADETPTKFTRGVVVVHKNQLLAEKYAPDLNKDTPMIGWSMTKTITSALIGILVKQGKMNVDDSASKYIPEWASDERKQITINDLLQMSSGLEWEEDYGNISDVTRLLFLTDDVFQVATNKRLAHKPQTKWFYSSGTTNILSGIIRSQFSDDQSYWAFPRQALFNKIGMRSMIMETDVSGTFIGSSYSFATLRDWARFGLLYLNDGVWNGERILPEGWVNYSVTPASASNKGYGAQIWLNADGEMPDVPLDVYSFNGFGGQRVFVFPTHDLVVVIMAVNTLDTFDHNAFLKNILVSVVKD